MPQTSFKRTPAQRQEQKRMDGLSSVLLDRGWAELPCDLDPEDLSLASFVLTNIYVSDESPEDLLDEMSALSFEGDLGDEVFEEYSIPSSALQFYFDIYGYGTFADSPPILVSFMEHSEDRRKQEYASFEGLDASDIHFLFEEILKEHAFVFPGTFWPIEEDDGSLRHVTWLTMQRSFNAIGVDIDGGYVDDVKQPLDDDSVAAILDSLPPELTPSYINLTGNGIHLWYVFSSPVQTFSKNAVRRRKLNSLVKGLYEIYSQLFESYDNINVDPNCATLNHAFRAPGSLTKENNRVRCFCPVGNVFVGSKKSAAQLSREVADLLGPYFPERDILTDKDMVFLSSNEIREQKAEWVEKRKSMPATEKQLALLRSYEDRGLLKGDEVAALADLNLFDAGSLISKARQRRNYSRDKECKHDTSEWTTKPHRLIAGRTGGVYNTVLSNIQKVKVGRRYNALNMLAGVAYMMTQPEKSRADLEADMLALLETPWARQQRRLTRRDVENALKGYKGENWQTVQTIISKMGFCPFKPSAKRNGRTREQHLKEYVPKCKAERVTKKIAEALESNPNAGVNDVVRATGLSKSSVCKYWAAGSERAGIQPTTPSERKLNVIRQVIVEKPGASKSEISRLTGFSRSTVMKYYDEAVAGVVE